MVIYTPLPVNSKTWKIVATFFATIVGVLELKKARYDKLDLVEELPELDPGFVPNNNKVDD